LLVCGDDRAGRHGIAVFVAPQLVNLELEYDRLLRLQVALLGRGGRADLTFNLQLDLCVGGRPQ